MNKKRILSIIMAALIFTSTCMVINPTKVSAGAGGDIAGIISNIAETFIGELHTVGLSAEAKAGYDGEFLFFLPPKFEANKFCITTFDYFNPRGQDTMYKVVVYNSRGDRPTVYNLHSGQSLELDTSPGTPEYIFEIYGSNNFTTPLDTIYLTDATKNLNNGIALAQNNNIYYLTKETNNRVVNQQFLAEYTKCDGYSMCSSDGNIHTFIKDLQYGGNNWIYERAYRKSRVVPRNSISANAPGDPLAYDVVLNNWYANEMPEFRIIPGLTTPTYRIDATSMFERISTNVTRLNDFDVQLLPNGEAFYAAYATLKPEDVNAEYMLVIDYRLTGTDPARINVSSCAVNRSAHIKESNFGSGINLQLAPTNGGSRKKFTGIYSYPSVLDVTTFIKTKLLNNINGTFVLEAIELYRVN